MLHINALSFAFAGRPLLEAASVGIPAGHKVGIVGRNGTGKTTLLKLIAGELPAPDGAIRMPKNARIVHVAQEASAGPETLVEAVMAADRELAALHAEAETATDAHRIAEIQTRLADKDAHSAAARAARILIGLGFTDEQLARTTAEFSGGWRMRVALAGALFAAPDILLLDEPTNYLDLEGTLWLEAHIRSYPHTAIIVSHDRGLLNRAVTHILHLTGGKLTLWPGGYDQFEEARREKQRLELKLKKKQDDERRRIQSFVDRFRAKATKAAQAQSRLKLLEKMQPIAAQVDDQVTPFILPNPERALGNPLVRFENTSVGYAPDRAILAGLNLIIDQDDRIGLLGANGNGKSTFAKMLAGELAPIGGAMRHSKKLITGYYTQHQLDALNPKASPYDVMSDLLPDATEAQRRARLGVLGFGADKADTVAEKLSGGERARLALAVTTFPKPHLLILDEPTNHLDVDSREALIHALMEYEGAMILISHDRHLMEACVDRLWIAKAGTVAAYDGDLAAYEKELIAERSGRNRDKARAAANGLDVKANRAEQRRDAAKRREELKPLKRQVDAREADVARLQNAIATLDAKLADPALYAKSPDEAARLSRERGEAKKALDAAELAWLEVIETYEAALSETADA